MTTEKRRPARLRRIKLDEVSLVDRPANPHARVTLFKRDDRRDDREDREMEIHKVGNGDEVASFDSLDEAIAAVAAAEGIPRHAAMSKIAKARPDLVAAHNAEGEERVAKAANDRLVQDPGQPGVAEAWRQVVDEIMVRDKCASRAVAMQRARAERPALYDRYRRIA